MPETDAQRAQRWQTTAQRTLETAKSLRDSEDARSCVSRAYYAVYQRVTAACIAHGDAPQFPSGWQNPSHEQLPDLIFNNSSYTLSVRRALKKILRELRTLREDSDYRMGQTVDRVSVRTALAMANAVFEQMEREE